MQRLKQLTIAAALATFAFAGASAPAHAYWDLKGNWTGDVQYPDEMRITTENQSQPTADTDTFSGNYVFCDPTIDTIQTPSGSTSTEESCYYHSSMPIEITENDDPPSTNKSGDKVRSITGTAGPVTHLKCSYSISGKETEDVNSNITLSPILTLTSSWAISQCQDNICADQSGRAYQACFAECEAVWEGCRTYSGGLNNVLQIQNFTQDNSN